MITRRAAMIALCIAAPFFLFCLYVLVRKPTDPYSWVGFAAQVFVMGNIIGWYRGAEKI